MRRGGRTLRDADERRRSGWKTLLTKQAPLFSSDASSFTKPLRCAYPVSYYLSAALALVSFTYYINIQSTVLCRSATHSPCQTELQAGYAPQERVLKVSGLPKYLT
jgi:hypothetical protein